MNSDPASLDNLRDIVVPPSVPWWPPAPGWWVVFALLTLAIAVFAWRRWRAWHANAYRREALRELQAATSAAEVAEILKRTVSRGVSTCRCRGDFRFHVVSVACRADWQTFACSHRRCADGRRFFPTARRAEN